MSNNQIVFVSDSIKTNNTWGGAEKDDEEMLSRLNLNILRKRSRELDHIYHNETYLISGFWDIPNNIKLDLISHGNYHIYEHDHHYCPTRNPSVYKNNNIVPRAHIIYRDFYSRAKTVFCMSKLHKQILTSNIKCNAISIGCSFWSNQRLDFINSLREESKSYRISKACIHNSDAPHKNTGLATSFCKRNNIDYELIDSTPNEEEFLRKLSKYSQLVFFPGSPETFCRTVVEAKMMNMSVITNENMIGAASEDVWRYNGYKLIGYIKNMMIPSATHAITQNLQAKICLA